MKLVFWFIIIFIIGIVGGIFANQILWPYFIERPLFYEYQLEQTPIYVTERKEITIQENIALKDAVEKVENTVVGIKTETEEQEILEGSGLIITSDGLLITLAELLPKGSDFSFFINGRYPFAAKWPGFQILKRDLKENLALVKIEETDLLTTSFADLEKIRLGERVFLIGVVLENGVAQKVVNEGIIKSFNENILETNIFEQTFVQGSPLFNIKGEVVGLSIIDSQGRVSAIPVSKIREFIGF